ncbi:hypothetical protein D3C85_1841320 [compost metagenome]
MEQSGATPFATILKDEKTKGNSLNLTGTCSITEQKEVRYGQVQRYGDPDRRGGCARLLARCAQAEDDPLGDQ